MSLEVERAPHVSRRRCWLLRDGYYRVRGLGEGGGCGRCLFEELSELLFHYEEGFVLAGDRSLGVVELQLQWCDLSDS